MKKVFTAVVVVFGLIAFIGCAKKVVSQPDTGVEEEAVAAMEPEVVEEVAVEPETEIVEQEVARVETEVLPAKPEVGLPSFDDVYFEFDKYDIKPEARRSLRELATWLINHESVILVEGHCDERGTNEYNLALGDRRATSVKEFLIASGVPERKIETVSYGEEKPVCTVRAESCWSRNRRAHFIVSEGG